MSISIRALYLGETSDGVKVHSEFLANCDAQEIFLKFKSESIPTIQAPYFIDLWDEEKSVVIDTVGVSEDTYCKITGETVLTYAEYERKSQFFDDVVFGTMQQQLRDCGVDIPQNESSISLDAAVALHHTRNGNKDNG